MDNVRLSELFGGKKRFAVLRELFLTPSRWFYTSEIARLADSPVSATNRWLNRWAKLGLVEKSVDGFNVRFRASPDPLLAGLHDIMLRNDALFEDIRAALPATVESAVIFGSVARGEERAESDIDVLVLGPELSSIRVGAALRAVGRKHDRVINASVHSTEQFIQMLRDDDGFAKSVISQKTIALRGDLPQGAA